jgi:glycosyltransferase involved in cell wall biosynthesis
MHLGLICSEYPPAPHGGIGSSNQDLGEGLTAAGHRVTVVGLYPRQFATSDSYEPNTLLNVVRLKASAPWLRYRTGAWLDRWRLRRWLQRENARHPFDIIEFSDYAGWLPWGGPKGVPIVCRLQGSNAFFDSELVRAGDQFEHDLERRSLTKADFWIGLSRYVFAKTLSLCGLKQHAGDVIHHAVDTDLFSPGSAEETEPGLIVFVNSVNPKKGIEQLLDAMNIVCRSHAEARLVVIGQDTQTKSRGRSYVEQLRDRVEPKSRDRVVFTGRVARHGVIPYLRKAAVCCYPSQMETFGIAPVEAMAVGRPTIYSRTGPGPEVIEDGVSGLLCDPFDPKDIAERILFLFRHPAQASRLGAEARKRAQSLFDKQKWIKRNVEFFHSCMKAVVVVKT